MDARGEVNHATMSRTSDGLTDGERSWVQHHWADHADTAVDKTNLKRVKYDTLRREIKRMNEHKPVAYDFLLAYPSNGKKVSRAARR